MELQKAAAKAKSEFRRRRLEEPRKAYEDEFQKFARAFGPLIDVVRRLASPSLDSSEISSLLASKTTRLLLRYVTAPPISADDLTTLAGGSLSSTSITRNPDLGKSIKDIIVGSLDRQRFGWALEQRDPTELEREIAIAATATLFAASAVGTKRRTEAKQDQERLVRECLISSGFEEVAKRQIRDVRDAPARGQFCGESKLGDTKADLVLVLKDRTVVPIECKVSNSEVNSFKRLIHEAAGKASKWISAFGRNAIMPVAILSGCFKVDNLLTAQRQGLSLFWTHDLEAFKKWLRRAK